MGTVTHVRLLHSSLPLACVVSSARPPYPSVSLLGPYSFCDGVQPSQGCLTPKVGDSAGLCSLMMCCKDMSWSCMQGKPNGRPGTNKRVSVCFVLSSSLGHLHSQMACCRQRQEHCTGGIRHVSLNPVQQHVLLSPQPTYMSEQLTCLRWPCFNLQEGVRAEGKVCILKLQASCCESLERSVEL